MTTYDFRALCAELTATLAERIDDKGDAGSYYVHAAHLLIRARAALADGPAVPQGKEPAAVITEPSDEEWDALVERVWDKYKTVGYQGERFMYDGDFDSALDLVRKELSRWGHQPAPPADGEVAELVAWLRMQGEAQKPGAESLLSTKTKKEMHANGSRLIRAAELLERQVLVPVAVSDALIKAECVLSDIAEGEPMTDEGDPLKWAERRCADTLAIIRPTMMQHKIRTSEWPPVAATAKPLPEVGE